MNKQRKEQIRKSLISFARAKFESSKQVQDGTSAATMTTTMNVEAKAPFEVVAPISPTPNALILQTFPILQLNPSSRVVELGCGDARWIIAIAKKFSCASCLGIDIDDERLDLARRNVQMEGLGSSIELRKEDVFEYISNCHLGGKGEQQNSDHSDSCVDSHVVANQHPRKHSPDPDLDPDPDLIILYLFRDAMKKVSGILKKKGFNSTTNFDKSGDTRGNVVQILCIGFILPGFIPHWKDQVDGINVHSYLISRDTELGVTR